MLRETLQCAITEALTNGSTKEGMNGVSCLEWFRGT
jgi:hypothetical protein